MTSIGELVEVVDAYIGWPWDARSVLVALVVDQISRHGWGEET